MMFFRLLLIVLLSLNCVTLYADQTAALPNTAMAAVTFTEDKTDVSLIASQAIFTIQLRSTPSTGYSWFLSDYDANLITPIRHTYQEAPLNNLPGSSGYELWTFQAAPGAFLVPRLTTIHFNYIRPWSVHETPKTVVFNMTTKQHMPE